MNGLGILRGLAVTLRHFVLRHGGHMWVVVVAMTVCPRARHSAARR